MNTTNKQHDSIDTANEDIASRRKALSLPKAAFETNLARANAMIAELEEQAKPKDEEKKPDTKPEDKKPGEAPTEQPDKDEEPEEKTGITRSIAANIKLQRSQGDGPRTQDQHARTPEQRPKATGLQRAINANKK